MIALLKGEVQHHDGEHLVLDVRGVGYLVHASHAVFEMLNGRAGQQVELIIHTDVKENDISLFGFATQLEKQVFLLLKRVKGIGSKLALSTTSSIGAELLLSYIAAGDVSQLQKVPGIGKKTAERAIVELREQVGQLVQVPATLAGRIERLQEVSGNQDEAPGPERDAVLALHKLGFPVERAKRAVAAAASAAPQERHDAGALLQRALNHIAE